jgi:hypothetical protein
MSVGSNLQEMENVVTKGAKPADPMPKLDLDTPGQTASWEDLGGPTPENYKSDDDSAKLKEPSMTLSQVKNVVNKGAKSADPMKKMSEEAEDEEEELDEDEEVVSEASDEGEEQKKGSNKKKKKEEDDGGDDDDEEEMEEAFDIEDDVNALLEGEELSEEFQEKARTIFEAAIKTKVAEIKEQLQSQYEESLVEQVVSIKE